MKQRIFYFDIIRIISCVMIVLMHSPMPGLGTPGPILSGISYITAVGVGLFFMISGGLILGNGQDKIAKGEFFATGFLYKRIVKIGVPLAIWMTVGYVFDDYAASECGVLWFLWTIFGLYLLSPILIRWISSADYKEVRLYLGIWTLTLCYPFVRLFVPMTINDTSWLYYFQGYVGYFVLGWYLMKKNHWNMYEKVILVVLFLLFSIAMPLSVLFVGIKVNFYDVFFYRSLSVVLMCMMWFVVMKSFENKFQKMSKKTKNAIVELSNTTFGVYLVHIIIMRGFLWKTEWMQNMTGSIQIPVCLALTFVISLVVASVLRKIPYVKVIVGG